MLNEQTFGGPFAVFNAWHLYVSGSVGGRAFCFDFITGRG
jgi:hypothetical protein